jgi:hypothetical protein
MITRFLSTRLLAPAGKVVRIVALLLCAAGGTSGIHGAEGAPPSAEPEARPAREEASLARPSGVSSPLSFRIGAWVQDLYELDVRSKSFSATIWLWATGSNGTREPLQSLQPVNLLRADKEAAFYGQAKRGDIYWSERKIKGQFRHDWDITNFPFDRHTLKIRLSEAFDDTFSLTYNVDARGSALSDQLVADGWRVSGFDIRSIPTLYNTAFGDPTLAFDNHSTRATVEISMHLERNSFSAFFKLTAIMYIAFVISLLTYFMHVENPSIMSPRVSLVAGALFSTALNMRSASAALGGDEVFTLVDRLHIVALITTLLAATMCVVSRLLYDAKVRPEAVRRANYSALALAIGFFLIANFVLIGMAAA